MLFVNFIKKILVLVFFLFIFLHPVRANENISLKIAPLSYDLAVDPGKEKTAEVFLENLSSKPAKIETEFSDFFIDDAGSYIFSDGKIVQNEELKPYSSRNWFSVPEKEFDLAAGEKKNTTITVSVPADAVLGGHYGAVFFRTVCDLPDDEAVVATDKSSLCISARTGVLFLIRAGGNARRSAQLGKVSIPSISFRDKADFLVEIKNTGNSHFRPEGFLSVKSLVGGGEVERVEIKDKTLLPTRTAGYFGKISRVDLLGAYKITGNIKDGDGNEMKIEKKMFLVPWKELLIFLGIIAAWTFFLKKLRIAKKKNPVG